MRFSSGKNSRFLPVFGIKKTTWNQLLSHTSGLVDPPSKRWINNKTGNTIKLAELTTEEIDKYLEGDPFNKTVDHPIYSNLGYGLLGVALEEACGKTYSRLLEELILQKIGMNHTFIGMPTRWHKTEELKLTFGKAGRASKKKLDPAKNIVGSSQGLPVNYWDTKNLPAFASVVSSIRDISLYFHYLLFSDSQESGIREALFDAKNKNLHYEIYSGIGWYLDKRYNGNLNILTGRTLGFSSFVGFSKKKSIAIICLADSDTIGNLPFHWLNKRFPRDRLYKTVRVSNDVLDKYEGEYLLAENKKIKIYISREQNCLKLHSKGEPDFVIYPRSRNEFFSRQLFLKAKPDLFSFKEEGGRFILCQNIGNQTIDIAEQCMNQKPVK